MRPHQDQLEQRLRREKPEHAAPFGFTERVMSKIPSDARSSFRSDSHPQQLLWPRLATAFALLAIAAVLLPELASQKSTHFTSGQANPSSSPHGDTSTALITEPLPLPTITQQQFQALTTQLDDPLEKELNNVISDTRIAIQFVAANFIPDR
ncbi:MAG TPA: hypothetical protein VF773_04480 [Verrucomicrobiae bacterium]